MAYQLYNSTHYLRLLKRCRLAVVSLGFANIAQIILLCTYIYYRIQLQRFNNDSISSFQIQNVEELIQNMNLFYSGSLIVCYFYVISWFFSINNYVRNYSSRLSFGKFWSIASWIIPFVNYIIPYKMTREVQNELYRLNSFEEQSKSRQELLTWWLFWIGGNICNFILTKLTLDDNLTTLTKIHLQFLILAFLIPAAFLLIRKIRHFETLVIAHQHSIKSQHLDNNNQ